MTNLEANKLPTQSIDYIKVLRILWSRWYWIAGCIIIAMALAYAYLWYTPKMYSTSASLKFVEEKSEITELLAVKNIYDRTNKVQTESYVIQSRDVLLSAISRLNYKVSYYIKGRVRTSEMYPAVPFPIEIVKQDTANFYRQYIDIKTVDSKSFELSYKTGTHENTERHKFGENIEIPGITFRVLSGPSATGSFSLKFNKKEDFLPRLSSGLSMREAAKSSNILLLTFKDKNHLFATDVLNAILKEYIYFDGYRRSLSASQTISFINDQLKFLSDQVKSSGTELANFKRDKKFINMESATQFSAEKFSSQQEQKNALKLEELSISQLEQRIISNMDATDYNFNIEGKVDLMLSGLVEQLNKFLLEKEKKLTVYNVNSAPIMVLDKQIADTKKAIISNIRSLKERNIRMQRYVDKQISSAENEVTELPGTERSFINLQSDFEINQKVFSYLFEKKLEAQISKAAVVPGASIVDFAEPKAGQLISPIPSKTYTYSFLWGTAVGIGLILLVRLSNPYIYDKETVESLTTTPIIGIIREFPGFIDKDNTQALSLQKPKSVFAESVRSVRTNLSFLAGEKKSKAICITSEISGEGKSFVSINLASTLALIDKKVVLLAADLRKSKLHKSFNTDNKKGLSTYLSTQDNLDSIVVKTSIDNLDFIPSGPVPPNPSELLHTKRMQDLIEELSELYDFVLLDTAPVGLVSDSIPLIRHADINIFVIRSGVSRYNAASIPDRLAGEYKLNNVVIVLNAVTDDAFHSRYYSSNYAGGAYQYYYSDYSGYSGDGYYSDDDKPKWWNIWKRFKG